METELWGLPYGLQLAWQNELKNIDVEMPR